MIESYMLRSLGLSGRSSAADWPGQLPWYTRGWATVVEQITVHRTSMALVNVVRVPGVDERHGLGRCATCARAGVAENSSEGSRATAIARSSSRAESIACVK